MQQALRVKWRVFVCFGLYFVNYRSWQAEILQERAEGCIQVDLQKKIRQAKIMHFYFVVLLGLFLVIYSKLLKIFFRHFI